MSVEYGKYLEQHIGAVVTGFKWLEDNIPEVVVGMDRYRILYHDVSKFHDEEYSAYDAYFYGERDARVNEEFNNAWLHHIHHNKHHWQHWCLMNDDPKEGIIALAMPYDCIVEMICDWWAFSWVKGDLTTIFKWYDEHKDYMKLHAKTRETVEDILDKIKNELEEK